MAEPQDDPPTYPDFATDANFDVDPDNPDSGDPTKLAMDTDDVEQGNKRGPNFPPDARKFNWWMNLVGRWVRRFVEERKMSYYEISGTTHNIVAANANKDGYTTSGSAVTVYLPKDATLNLAIGQFGSIRWHGVGQPTFAPEDGTVTVNSSGNAFKVAARYDRAFWEKTGSNEYLITGAKAV
jgi:hypothetical protein